MLISWKKLTKNGYLYEGGNILKKALGLRALPCVIIIIRLGQGSHLPSKGFTFANGF